MTRVKTYFISLDVIDSTNTWVKEHHDSLDPKSMTCVSAEGQLQGRGRGKKSWSSPVGKNLYVSLYTTRKAPYLHLPHLAQVLSFSCAQVLLKEGIPIQLKWPNDLMIREKKCGGVLVEVISSQESLGLVLGLGLNVNMEEEELKGIEIPATSLKIETGKVWDKQKLLEKITERFIADLQLLDMQGFAAFLPHYEKMLIHRNGDPFRGGKYRGLSGEGGVLIELTSGKIITLFNADEGRTDLESP